MKRLIFLFPLVFFFASVAHAATTLTYVPLEPIPGVSQTGTSLPAYLSGAYMLLVTVGSLAAVVMITISGIRYMLSESFTDKDAAKKRIVNALWGLIILVGSFVILYTLNPALLHFNFNPVTTPAPQTNFGGTTNSNPTTNTNNQTSSLVTLNSLTNAQYTSLNSALNPSYLQQALSGSQYVAVGAYPTDDPASDPNVQTFENDCENYGSGATNIATGVGAGVGALAGYFSPIPGGTIGGAALGGYIGAGIGSSINYTVQPVSGDQLGLPSGTTVEACVYMTQSQ